MRSPEPTGKGPLTLYSRLGCSLCEAMELELEPFRRRLGFTVEIVDIDADPELAERYGARVPVLAAGERELCEYFLDGARLERYFTGH